MRAMDVSEVISVDPDTSVQALATPTSRLAVGGGGGQT
jgi:hypothetical protein